MPAKRSFDYALRATLRMTALVPSCAPLGGGRDVVESVGAGVAGVEAAEVPVRARCPQAIRRTPRGATFSSHPVARAAPSDRADEQADGPNGQTQQIAERD